MYVNSNQMQQRPPENAPFGSDHDITHYSHQLAGRAPDHQLLPYNYAMSQIGHEMGHRWAAFVSAKVMGETIPLGPSTGRKDCRRRLHFHISGRPRRPQWRGVWQDNFDGTFTQLDDDYYVPATGYSYLDLYLMVLISAAEVPDFFIILEIGALLGKDTDGHPGCSKPIEQR